MKVVGIALLVFSICATAWAAIGEVNDDNINAFIDLFPKYKQLIEQIGDQAPVDQTISTVAQNRDKLNALFESYDMTLQEFAQLVQKITIGYASAKIKAEGPESDPFGLSQLGSLTDNERAAIKNNLDKLEKIFDITPPEQQKEEE